jgi:N-acetylglutamate synthase
MARREEARERDGERVHEVVLDGGRPPRGPRRAVLGRGERCPEPVAPEGAERDAEEPEDAAHDEERPVQHGGDEPRRACHDGSAVTTVPDEPALEIERRALAAWPAATVEDLDGWKLRYTAGVTRRANSVWPGGLHGGIPLDERIDRVERFYDGRGAPAIFQLAPLPGAAGLDAALARRGYRIDAPVWVQTAPLDALAARSAPGGGEAARSLAIAVQRAPDAAWLHVAVDRGRFRDARDVFTALLGRIGDRARYATALAGDDPVAIALGVVDPPYVGLFNMVTLPEHRRRGAARALLGALARDALTAGASEAYLQVEQDNVGALALYGSAGFSTRYGYHYRVGG